MKPKVVKIDFSIFSGSGSFAESTFTVFPKVGRAMQLGFSFTLAFYAIATAMVIGIFGFGAVVYRHERRLTWHERLAKAHRPWEQSEPPFVSYIAGAFIILLSFGFSPFSSEPKLVQTAM